MAIGIFNQQKYITASDKALAFIQSQMSLHSSGHLPVSYLVPGPPTADPLWNLSSPSSGVPYIYKAQQRCWIDSAGLALLVLTTSNDYVRCKVIMNKMQSLPKSSGGFYSSYDVVEGHLGNDIPVHTGKIAWLVWGMCYYALISGDSSYSSMINAAGTWLLGRQVNNINDKCHGLLKGGFDENGEIQWCSTENNLSALQALQGLYSLTNDSNYINAANLIIERLKPTPVLSSQPSLYFGGQNRYYQGVNAVKLDDGLALDSTTWAGATAKNLLPDSGILPNRDTIASNCRSTAYSNFLVTGISTLSGVYGGYSLNSAVKGFKPFANSGDPSFIWSEGTLGYIHLCLLLNENQAALDFMNETIEMQNCKAGQNGVLYSIYRITAQDTEFRVWESVVSSAWLYLLINNPKVLFPKLPFPVISGASFVGASGVTFSVSGAPSGYTWGFSSNLKQDSTNPAKFFAYGNGSGWVSINLGAVELVRHEVWVGTPPTYSFEVSVFPKSSKLYYGEAMENDFIYGIDSFLWITFDNSWKITERLPVLGPSMKTVSIVPPSASAETELWVSAHNSAGWSDQKYIGIMGQI